MSSIKIYVEDDSELANFEALNKGFRSDVYVEIGQLRYKLAVHDIVRLQQDVQSEYENYGYYEVYPNLIIVKEVTIEEITRTVTHLYQCNFFEHLKPINSIVLCTDNQITKIKGANMKKKITKEEFITQKGQHAYNAMTDFLNLEIDDDFIEVMYSFLSVANFRAGEYEGNQYLLKKLNAQEVMIIDISGEGFVEEEKLFRFNISVAEFLYILDEIDDWRKDFWKN